MHIVKPEWLNHPDGHVRIWSTEAIYNAADPNYTKPKQLAAISNHSGTIHAVRFSGNNKYLASGADDKIVCVYVLDPNPPAHGSTFGTNEPPPVENWRVLRRLIGHDNDVQDLGWSYDSSILVSVGLDSKIVVWSGHTFEKLKTLSQHQSHVKGITFDPANKYFATASDDRTVKVFRFTSPPPNATAYDQLNNFVLESNGNHIAAPNAVNGPVGAIAIINRGSWASDINLIGHEGPTAVCAFSPRMFYQQPVTAAQIAANGLPNVQSVTVIACAGQDKALSIWNTNYARPFVITQELCEKSISDLAWSPDGEKVFLTSLDGRILVAMFEPGELGYPAPVQESERMLSKFGAGRKTGVIEGTDALLLEESSKADELKGVQGRMGELMGDGATSAAATTNGVNGDTRTNGVSTTNGQTAVVPDGDPPPQQPTQDPRIDKLKQRVTITKDGKKRIQPLLVSASSGLAESSLPQTQLLSASAQGARSDAPYNILDLSKPYDGFPKGGLAGLLVGNKRKFAEIEGDEERRIEKRLAGSSRDGQAPIVMNSADGLVPPVLPSGQAQRSRPRYYVLQSSIQQHHEPPQTNTGDMGSGPRTDAAREDVIVLEARNAVGPSRTGRAQDRDPARITCTKRGQTLWQDYLPKAVLSLTGNTNFWAAACEDGSMYVWTPAGRRLLNALVVEAQPVIIDCRGWWLLCISAIGMCHVWNLKTLSSPHPAVSLAPVLDAAVASQGPHLTQAPGVIFARLNTQGRIIVAMSNGDGYAYSPNMFVWQRLSEPWWAVGSQYWNTTDSSVGNLQTSSSGQAKALEENDMVSPENLSAGIIPILERNTTNHTLLRGRAFFLQRLIKALLSAEGFEGFESSVSIAHLENRVAAAMTLGAREEFRIYLLMYAKRLGAESLRGKIEELLRNLLGNIFEDDAEPMAGAEDGLGSPKDEICGWKREDLLKDVVLILGKHRDLQRITVPYARLLGVIGGQPHDEGMDI
ncbi:HIR complex subunit [Coniosporium tulheliwenetii]|uniref:HIR complex subunit n=1 Tax=Coniosporium tulheliwenetii TaxID=3383036 RepID=A0ACC2ZJZ9_9PEZI|nr:HIR complex subunit [Cladosporium sp. JES 115]